MRRAPERLSLSEPFCKRGGATPRFLPVPPVKLAWVQRLSVGGGAGAAASRSLLFRSASVMEGKVPRSPELSAESPSSAGFKTYSAAAASSAGRISLVSRHLSSPSSYNAASAAQSLPSSTTQNRRLSTSTTTMSSQPPHATLLIPGPIEFDDAVLQSMSHYR